MDPERFHIVAAPPRGASAALIRRIGGILGLSPYDARLRLNAALPRSLAMFTSAERAVSAGEALGAEGVPTAVFAESRLPPAPPFAVRRWEWADDELRAADKQGRVRVLPVADVAQLVFGRRVVVRTELNIETQAHMTASGSVQTTQVVTRERMKDLPLFALLLPHNLGRAAVLFDADGLAFDCLPGRREPSDNANMLRLFEVIRAACPDVPVDRTLLERRVEPEHCHFDNRRIGADPAVTVGYVLWYLRRAEAASGGFFNAAAENDAASEE